MQQGQAPHVSDSSSAFSALRGAARAGMAGLGRPLRTICHVVVRVESSWNVGEQRRAGFLPGSSGGR